MKAVFSIFILSLLFLSCKKDKLKDDKEIFIGKWKWVYSVNISKPFCTDPPVTTIFTPTTQGENYSMEFLKKGYAKFYKNDEEIDKYRIVFGETFQLSSSGYSHFEILLDNKKNKYFVGNIKNDTLIESGRFFPFKGRDESCSYYSNYFVRE